MSYNGLRGGICSAGDNRNFAIDILNLGIPIAITSLVEKQEGNGLLYV